MKARWPLMELAYGQSAIIYVAPLRITAPLNYRTKKCNNIRSLSNLCQHKCGIFDYFMYSSRSVWSQFSLYVYVNYSILFNSLRCNLIIERKSFSPSSTVLLSVICCNVVYCCAIIPGVLSCPPLICMCLCMWSAWMSIAHSSVTSWSSTSPALPSPSVNRFSYKHQQTRPKKWLFSLSHN